MPDIYVERCSDCEGDAEEFICDDCSRVYCNCGPKCACEEE